jgi:hypothetical protein
MGRIAVILVCKGYCRAKPVATVRTRPTTGVGEVGRVLCALPPERSGFYEGVYHATASENTAVQ